MDDMDRLAGSIESTKSIQSTRSFPKPEGPARPSAMKDVNEVEAADRMIYRLEPSERESPGGPEVATGMDVLKTLAEKAFWGHEFLTWLWFRAEEGGGELEVEEFGPISLWIEDRMVLGSLETDSKENILKDGDVSKSAEAAAALGVGKKLEQARFGLVREDREWAFTLKGDTFELNSVKIPKVMTEEGDDFHATVLVRLGHLRELTDLLDALFREFAALRVSPAWEREVAPAVTRWIEAKEGG